MSEDKVYKDGDIVWVKLGNNWWPGEVTGPTRHPEGLVQHLKRVPYCVVKFFNENTYEYVRSGKQIFPFECPKQEEFIKKGYSLYNSGNSFMEKFPADVDVARELIRRKETSFIINDRPDSIVKAILGQPLIQIHDKSYDDSEHQEKRGDYFTKILNITRNRKSDSGNSQQPEVQTCDFCGFTSVRLNVMILHRKIHSNRNSLGSNNTKNSSTLKSANSKSAPSVAATNTSVDNYNKNQQVKNDKNNKTKVSTISMTIAAPPRTPSPPRTADESETNNAAKNIDTPSKEIHSEKAKFTTPKSKTKAAKKSIVKAKKEENAYATILSDFCPSDSESSPSPEEKQSRRSLRHCKTINETTASKEPTICIDLSEPKTIQKIPKKREYSILQAESERSPKVVTAEPDVVCLSDKEKNTSAINSSAANSNTAKKDAEDIRRMLLADWSDDDETPTDTVHDTLDDSIVLDNVKNNETSVPGNEEQNAPTLITRSTPVNKSSSATTARIRNIPKKDRRDVVLQDFNSDLSYIQNNRTDSVAKTMTVELDSSNSSVVEIIEEQQPTAIITINDDDDQENPKLQMNQKDAIVAERRSTEKSVSANTSTTSLSCFDFQDDDDEHENTTTTISHFKKKYLSGEKLQSLSVTSIDDLKENNGATTRAELAEKDKRLAADIETLLEQTQPTVVDLLNASSFEETLSVKDLPIKERGKRIFKSRNKTRLAEKVITEPLAPVEVNLPTEMQTKEKYNSKTTDVAESPNPNQSKKDKNVLNEKCLVDISSQQILPTPIFLEENQSTPNEKKDDEISTGEYKDCSEMLICDNKSDQNEQMTYAEVITSIENIDVEKTTANVRSENYFVNDKSSEQPIFNQQQEPAHCGEQENFDSIDQTQLQAEGELNITENIENLKEIFPNNETQIQPLSHEKNYKSVDTLHFQPSELRNAESKDKPVDKVKVLEVQILKHSQENLRNNVEKEHAEENAAANSSSQIIIEGGEKSSNSFDKINNDNENNENQKKSVENAFRIRVKTPEQLSHEALVMASIQEQELQKTMDSGVDSHVASTTSTDENSSLGVSDTAEFGSPASMLSEERLPAFRFRSNQSPQLGIETPEVTKSQIDKLSEMAKKVLNEQREKSKKEQFLKGKSEIDQYRELKPFQQRRFSVDLDSLKVEPKPIKRQRLSEDGSASEQQTSLENPQEIPLTIQKTNIELKVRPKSRHMKITPRRNVSALFKQHKDKRISNEAQNSKTLNIIKETLPVTNDKSVLKHEQDKDVSPVSENCKEVFNEEHETITEKYQKSKENEQTVEGILEKNIEGETTENEDLESASDREQSENSAEERQEETSKNIICVKEKATADRRIELEAETKSSNTKETTTDLINIKEAIIAENQQLSCNSNQNNERMLEKAKIGETTGVDNKSIAKDANVPINIDKNFPVNPDETSKEEESETLKYSTTEPFSIENCITQTDQVLAKSLPSRSESLSLEISKTQTDQVLEKSLDTLYELNSLENSETHAEQVLQKSLYNTCKMSSLGNSKTLTEQVLEKSLPTTNDLRSLEESENHSKQVMEKTFSTKSETFSLESNKIRTEKVLEEAISTTSETFLLESGKKQADQQLDNTLLAPGDELNLEKIKTQTNLVTEKSLSTKMDTCCLGSIKTKVNQLLEKPLSPDMSPSTPQEREVVKESQSLNLILSSQQPVPVNIGHLSEISIFPLTLKDKESSLEKNKQNFADKQGEPISCNTNEKENNFSREEADRPLTPSENTVIINSTDIIATVNECKTFVGPSTPQQSLDMLIEFEDNLPEPDTPKEINTDDESENAMQIPSTPQAKDLIIECEPSTPQGIIECDHNLPTQVTPEKEVIIESDVSTEKGQDNIIEENLRLDERESLLEREFQQPKESCASADLPQEPQTNSLQTDADKAAEEFLIEFDSIVNHSHTVEEGVQNSSVEDALNADELINNIIEEVHEDPQPREEVAAKCETPLQFEPLTAYTVVSNKNSLNQIFKDTLNSRLNPSKRRQTICFGISDTKDGVACKKQAFDFESLLPVNKTIKRTAERKLTLPAIETKLSNCNQPHSILALNHNQITINKKLIPTAKRKLSIEDNITSFIIERPNQLQQPATAVSGPPPLQRIRPLRRQSHIISKTSSDNLSEPPPLQSHDNLLNDLFSTESPSPSQGRDLDKKSEDGRILHQQTISGPTPSVSVVQQNKSTESKISKNKQIGVDSRGNKYVIIKTPPTDIVVQPKLTSSTAVTAPTTNNFGTTITIQPIARSGSEISTTKPITKNTNNSKQQQQLKQISITVPAKSSLEGSNSPEISAKALRNRRKTSQAKAIAAATAANTNINSAKHRQTMEALSRRLSIASETPPLAKISRPSSSNVQTQISNKSNISTLFGDAQISNIAQQQLLQLQQQQQTIQTTSSPLPPPIILNKNAHQQSVIQRKARKISSQQQTQLQHQQSAAVKSPQLIPQQQHTTQQQSQQLQQQIITQIALQQQHNSLQPPPLQQMQQQAVPMPQQIVQQSDGVIITTAAAEDDDVIDSNTQLIALPTQPYPGYAETFLLCKVKGNTCKPVDNVPLYLNQQLNELVPVPLEAIESGQKTQERLIEIKPSNAAQQLLGRQNNDHQDNEGNLQLANINCNLVEDEISAGIESEQQIQNSQQHQIMEECVVDETASNTQINDFGGNQELNSDVVSNNGILLNIEGQQVLLDAATFAHLLANPDANTQLISDDGTEYVLTHEVLQALQLQQEQQQALELVSAAAEQHQQQLEQTASNDIIAVALAGSDLYDNDVLTIDTSQGMQLIDGDGSIVFPAQTGSITQQHLTPPAVVTNAVLDQSPIMSTLEVPSSLATAHKLQGTQLITVPSHHLAASSNAALGLGGRANLEDSLAAIGVTTQSSSIPSSLGLPITVTNPNIASKVTSAGPLNEMLQFVSHRPATAAATAAAVAAAALAGETRIFTD